MFDPSEDFTVPENVPVGVRPNEYVLRQLIGYAFQNIRDNIDRPDFLLIDELFTNFGPVVIDQIKAWFRSRAPAPAPAIATVVNFPRPDLSLPFIACVNGADLEDERAQFMGDYTGTMEPPRESTEAVIRDLRGVGTKITNHLYVAATDADLVIFLAGLVRYILSFNKGGLESQYDIKNLCINMQDVQWDEKFFPTFCYIRLLTVTYDSQFDFALAPASRMVVSLSALVDAGYNLNVPVPST